MNELTQAEDRKGPGAEPQGIPKLKSLEEEEPATHFGVVSKAEGKTRNDHCPHKSQNQLKIPIQILQNYYMRHCKLRNKTAKPN